MQQPLLIYVVKLNARIDYILKFIFRDVVVIPFTFTESVQKYINYDGPKMCYGESLEANSYYIKPAPLMLATDITEQNLARGLHDGVPYILKTESNILPYDAIGACFYMLTRYEEYLPYSADAHGRFPHESSIAFKNNFIHLPIVNIWIAQFIKALQNKFPDLQAALPSCKHQRTYDIDMAFCYGHKGASRTLGAMLREIFTGNFKALQQRFKIINKLQADPFDTFDLIKELHSKQSDKALFFILSAKHSKFDKNISLAMPAMQHIIQSLKSFANIGIHPGYYSNESISVILQEKAALEKVVDANITHSRQHYIKNKLPITYQLLVEAGITDDYSMGYGSINGFRAGTGTSHRWFNVNTNKVENLQVHPFCWMDTTSLYEQKLSAIEAHAAHDNLNKICKKYHTNFTTIWHNSSLGDVAPWHNGWLAFYKKTFE